MNDTPPSPRIPRTALVIILLLAVIGVGSMLAAMALSGRRAANAAPTDGLAAAGVATPTSPADAMTLPPFELLDQHGRPFGSEDLADTVWVADFMFTRCEGVCPMLNKHMAELQAALKDHPQRDRVRLVSISVDSGHDTPSVLRQFAERHEADPSLWRFLTGPRDQVWPLIREGFKLGVDEDPDNAAMPFMHSSKFVLVQGRDRIVGYYDALDAEARAALLDRIDEVLAVPPPGAGG